MNQPNDDSTMSQLHGEASSTTTTSNNDLNSVPKWAKGVLKHGADLGTKLVTYQNYQSKVALLDNAAGIISAPNIDVEYRLSTFVDFQKTNTTILPDQCTMSRCGVPVHNLPDVAKTMTSEDVNKLETNILHSLKDLKQQMANNFMLTSAAFSAGIIVLQIVKLYNVWKEIKKAENLHKNETNLLDIEQKLKEFEELCTKLNESINKQQINRVLIQSNRLNVKYNETLRLINKLQFKIDVVMQSLDLAGDAQFYDGLSNFVMATGNTVQLVAVFDFLSGPVKLISGTIIGLFYLLIVGNGVMYKLSQKRLDELRADYKKLHQFESQLMHLNSDIQKVLEEQEDKL